MKKLSAVLFLLLSLSAFGHSRTCEMSSRGNRAQIILTQNASGVLVQLAEEEPDQCILENSRNFDLLARCGSNDDSTYFGVKGSSGRVYEGSTTIAQLKKCKRL